MRFTAQSRIEPHINDNNNPSESKIEQKVQKKQKNQDKTDMKVILIILIVFQYVIAQNDSTVRLSQTAAELYQVNLSKNLLLFR